MYQEYPKALYRNGVYHEVATVEAEEAARDEGFTDWHSDASRNEEDKTEAPRRGRPPKAKQEA